MTALRYPLTILACFAAAVALTVATLSVLVSMQGAHSERDCVRSGGRVVAVVGEEWRCGRVESTP